MRPTVFLIVITVLNYFSPALADENFQTCRKVEAIVLLAPRWPPCRFCCVRIAVFARSLALRRSIIVTFKWMFALVQRL